MVANVRFSIEDDILIVKASGVWQRPGDSLAFLLKVLEKAESEKLNRVLYLSEVTGRAPTTLESHFLGERAAAILGSLVLGYVPLVKYEEKKQDAIRFITQVAQNRGLIGRQFEDPGEARAWLLSQRTRPSQAN